MADAAAARDIAQKRQRLEREAQHRRTGRVKTLEDFMAERAEGGAAALRIIIKADQGGPAEALADALAQLSTPEVKVEVVHRGVGAITDSDVLLAKASNAIIIGFHVRPDSNARASAEREKVEIRTYRIIYEAVEEVKAAMRSEEHTSELQSQSNLVCRLLLEKKKTYITDDAKSTKKQAVRSGNIMLVSDKKASANVDVDYETMMVYGARRNTLACVRCHLTVL